MRLLIEECLEKYLKKLIGRTDLEDGLKRLDKLTLEESRMATAENLKATHAVDERVKGVDNRVADVDDRVAGVDDRLAGVDDRLQRAADDVDEMKRSSFLNLISADYGSLPVVSGNQLRNDIHKWLSPPDTSTNHNIACGTHHKKTASRFFQGSIFQEWKSTGSLLWIHGKRLSHPPSSLAPSNSILHCSWLG